MIVYVLVWISCIICFSMLIYSLCLLFSFFLPFLFCLFFFHPFFTIVYFVFVLISLFSGLILHESQMKKVNPIIYNQSIFVLICWIIYIFNFYVVKCTIDCLWFDDAVEIILCSLFDAIIMILTFVYICFSYALRCTFTFSFISNHQNQSLTFSQTNWMRHN